MKNINQLILSVIFLGLFNLANFGQVVKEYLFSSEIETKVKAETKNWNLQNLAVQYSLSGNYKASLETHKLFLEKNKSGGNSHPEFTPDFQKNFKPVNALKAIAKEAEKYQVVITNEAHYQPQNRVFTATLLRVLYDKGFRYFAVEDLTPDDEILKSKRDGELNSRQYPINSTGYYIVEPQYGNLVREAIRIGFKVVPYEYNASDKQDPVERIFGREQGQARNIAQIIKDNPTAKVVVHCGYGHLNEAFDEVGQMGGYLKNEFKIDPLTIDQTNLLEENNNPFSSVFPIKEPSVFVSSKGYFSNSYSLPNGIFQADVSVAFPKTTYLNGRPNWLMLAPNRKYFFVKTKDLKVSFPLMILAYRKGEDLNTAIPVDVIELNSANEKKALVLAGGHYVLLVRNLKGEMNKFEIRQ